MDKKGRNVYEKKFLCSVQGNRCSFLRTISRFSNVKIKLEITDRHTAIAKFVHSPSARIVNSLVIDAWEQAGWFSSNDFEWITTLG